jgi:hypothetical protein
MCPKVAKFFLINLSETKKEIQLPEDEEITIGRHIDNIIRISNDLMLVSRFHAKIRIRGGKCYFEDLNNNKNDSYKTSYRDYQGAHKWDRLQKGSETFIENNTVIRLGGKNANIEMEGANVCDIKIIVKEIEESDTTTIIANDNR